MKNKGNASVFANNNWFYIFSVTAILLMIASFLAPPTGVIDPSVIAAAGVIFAFAALGTVIKAIDKGTSAKITKGDTSLTVGSDNNKTARYEE